MNDLLMQARDVFDYRLFEVSGMAITVATVAMFLIIFLMTLVISWMAQRAVGHLFARRGVKEEGTVEIAKRLIHYLLLTVGVGVGLQTLGINLTAVFAAGAVLAVGVGLAMQNLVQNFVSGIILLLERSIKPGDVLEVEGEMVKVSRMALRATHVRTLNDDEIIVPNSTIVQSSVKNYTLRDPFLRIRCPVGVTYGSDMIVVKETLVDAAKALEWRATERDPVILLTEFGNSSVNFEVSVWIDDPWKVRKGRSNLYEAIWWALKAKNITIAFPQLDLHLDQPVIDSIRMRAAC